MGKKIYVLMGKLSAYSPEGKLGAHISVGKLFMILWVS